MLKIILTLLLIAAFPHPATAAICQTIKEQTIDIVDIKHIYNS
jgi:hypothetical protein